MFKNETTIHDEIDQQIMQAGNLGLDPDGDLMKLLRKGSGNTVTEEKGVSAQNAIETGNPDERELISSLNHDFKVGKTIAEVSEKLRKLRKPILVDWNNVLVSNGEVLEVNPVALKALSELRTIGTVVILTAASDWNFIKDFLVNAAFFSQELDDLVLITAENYEQIFDDWHNNPPEVFEQMEQYLNLAHKHNLLEPSMLNKPYDQLVRSSVAGKRVAFAFGMPFLIPLIDDSPGATERNPGIKGITVVPFTSQDEDIPQTRASAIPLLDAVEQVRTYYATIDDTNAETDSHVKDLDGQELEALRKLSKPEEILKAIQDLNEKHEGSILVTFRDAENKTTLFLSAFLNRINHDEKLLTWLGLEQKTKIEEVSIVAPEEDLYLQRETWDRIAQQKGFGPLDTSGFGFFLDSSEQDEL